MRASVRAMTRKSFDERASTATLIWRAASAIGITRRPGVCPHFFGIFLVLDLDRLRAGFLIAAHGVVDVEQPAIAGVAIGDQRRRTCPRAICLHAADHLGVARQPRIRQAEMRGDHAVAGHVERIEPHAVGDARGNHVEDAGRRDQAGLFRGGRKALRHRFHSSSCCRQAPQATRWCKRRSSQSSKALARHGNDPEQKDRRHDGGHVMQADGVHDEVAEPALRGEHFADQHAEQRQREADAHAGDDLGQRPEPAPRSTIAMATNGWPARRARKPAEVGGCHS